MKPAVLVQFVIYTFLLNYYIGTWDGDEATADPELFSLRQHSSTPARTAADQ
jgi:hypothetical protein